MNLLQNKDTYTGDSSDWVSSKTPGETSRSKYGKESNPFGYISDITGSSMLGKPLTNWRLVILPTIQIIGKIDIKSIFNQDSSIMNEEEGNMNKSFAQMKDSLIQTPRNNGNQIYLIF